MGLVGSTKPAKPTKVTDEPCCKASICDFCSLFGVEGVMISMTNGLYFFFSAYMNPDKIEHLQDLIAAAGGNILQRDTLHLFHENACTSSVKLHFIYNGGAPKEFTMSSLLDLRKEVEEGTEFAAWGAQLINHLRVFDAIAGYDAQILNH